MTMRGLARILLAVSCAALALGGTAATPAGNAAALSSWTGKVDLYRTGTFTTQKTWLWCTAADVQIIRNITRREADHARASQQRYFDYMRAHNRYDIPESEGVDPVGWTAGLRHYVDGRYRLVTSGSFDAALRSAVTSLRQTGLPVGITVSHGSHAWVLTGFSATADPATTTTFSVTSVRVVGPLWGLQSRSYGYDMRPATSLTPKQLRGFFTPWHYAAIRMAWEGRWVAVQAAPAKVVVEQALTPPAVPRRLPPASAAPSSEPAAGPSSPAVAVLPAQPSTAPSEAAGVGQVVARDPVSPVPAAALAIALGAVVVISVLGVARRPGRQPRPAIPRTTRAPR